MTATHSMQPGAPVRYTGRGASAWDPSHVALGDCGRAGRSRFGLAAWCIAVVLCLATAGGCQRGDPGIVPVSGKVEFMGRARPQVCRLTFVPVDESGALRSTGGTMQPDGRYELTKFRGKQGLYPGSYRVKVAYYDLKPGGNPDSDGDWNEVLFDVPEVMEVVAGPAVSYDIEVPSR